MLYVYIPLLILIGILLGYIYFISHKLIKEFYNKVKLNIIIKCLIGGILLGIIGYLLPLTMFSGEEQIEEILLNGTSIGILILILTSILKIILTNICIESGLKGGHFFPMIFSGIAFGFAMSLLLNIDPVISMAVVTTSFLSNIMKKPIAVVLLLIIVFPVNLIPIMLLSSVISCLFKTPKWIEI
jgi:H+/Cl- antiporter ClcA